MRYAEQQTYTFVSTIQLASSVLKQIQLSMKEGVLYVEMVVGRRL